MYVHLIDSNIIEMFIKNKTDHVVQILKKLRLNMLYEIDYKNVFFIELTILSSKCLSKFFTNIN